MPTTHAFIGREHDLAVALEQLDRAGRGRPASLLIRGEAGIGKSRLTAELVGRAQAAGFATLHGRADDFDRGIPYAVVRDMLAGLPAPSGAGPLRTRLDDLRAGLDAGAGMAGAPVDAHLLLVFDRAVELLRALTGGGPAVIAVDDAHLADADSLALVGLLARLGDVPLLTALAMRPAPSGPARDLARLAERLAEDGRGAVVDLAPMAREEIEAFVAAELGAQPDRGVIDETLALSAGNPFFAGASLRALREADALRLDGGHAYLVDARGPPATPSAAALVARALGDDPGRLELARLVAAFGRLDLRHLPLAARLAGREEAGVIATFDELVGDHLLVRTRQEGYEFAHGILRDAVYAETGPAERRRLHGGIAAELARERRAGAPLGAAELATHVGHSAEPGDEAAVDILLDAARTISATAPLVSAEHYGRAIDLLGPGPRRAEALALRARSLQIGSRPAEAAAVGAAALEELPSGPLRRATVALVINSLNLVGEVAAALEVIESELADGGPPVPLLAQRTHMLLGLARPREAAEQAVEAVRATDAARPSSARLVAITHLFVYATDHGDMALAGHLAELLEAAGEEGPVPRRRQAHEAIALLDRRPGIVGRIERHLEAAEALARGRGLPSIGGHVETARAHTLLLRGDWDAALELSRSAMLELEQRGALLGALLVRLIRCDIHTLRGDVDEAAALLDGVDAPFEELRTQIAVYRARLARATGDRDGALAILEAQERRSAETETMLRRPELLVELCEVLAESGRLDEARALAAEAEERACPPTRFEWPVTAAYLRGRLWADADAATRYAALAADEELAFDGARAALLLGELGVEPRENLTSAYRAFDALGAGRWRRTVAGELRAAQLPVPRPAAGRTEGPLTDTELRLASLVRDGLTNRQIASTLQYSPKTVETYLSRVYAKTGCASRVELVKAMERGEVALT